MPEEGYSTLARDFVKGCLHKIPKMRPTYAMLLNHPWLQNFSKPPTISERDEDDAAEAAAQGLEELSIYGDDGKPFPTGENSYDEDVANWVKNAMEKKRQGLLGSFAKPALHAAPLDSVSPAAVPQADPLN